MDDQATLQIALLTQRVERLEEAGKPRTWLYSIIAMALFASPGAAFWMINTQIRPIDGQIARLDGSLSGHSRAIEALQTAGNTNGYAIARLEQDDDVLKEREKGIFQRQFDGAVAIAKIQQQIEFLFARKVSE